MVHSRRVASVLLALFCQLSFLDAFSVRHHSSSTVPVVRPFVATPLRLHSEYTFVDDDNEDDNENGPYRYRTTPDTPRNQNDSSSAASGEGFYSESDVPAEFAALATGSSMRIKVGNLEQSRKAWKKRRRSGSPLLVPCSVLNIDRKTMVVSSMVYLLQKFGLSISEQGIIDPPAGFRSKDIAISVSDLGQYYRKHLQSSLKKHGEALGYFSPNELVSGLMTEDAQTEHGVNLFADPEGRLWLLARMSRLHGHRKAAEKVVLQFCDYGDEIVHTGETRLRSKDRLGGYTAPLSAALKVSQRAVDTGVIVQGSVLSAVISQFDPAGDAGAPLLRLSLNKPAVRRKPRSLQKKAEQQDIGRLELTRMLNELKAGEGPIEGRIVKVSPQNEMVTVDIGVGRKVKTLNGGHTVERVMATLRFDDFVQQTRNPLFEAQDKQNMKDKKEQLLSAIRYEDEDSEEEEEDDDESSEDNGSFQRLTVEDFFSEKELNAMDEMGIDEFEFNYDEEEAEDEGEEAEEDITHLVKADAEGNLSFEDPDTGKVTEIGNMNDISVEFDKDVEDDDDDDDIFAGLTAEERLEKLGEIMAEMDVSHDENDEEYEDLDDAEEMALLNDVLVSPLDGDGREDGKGDVQAVNIVSPSKKSSTKAISASAATTSAATAAEQTPPRNPRKLKAGDSVTVFVQAVSKQSGKCTLTTNANVQPMKVVKKEAGASKKLERLIQRMGGDVQALLELKGKECEGVVKATSKTGDWLYVQPDLDLPVGVAQLAEELAEATLTQGDTVRVRLDGVDESRGQLTMTVTAKSAP